MLGRAVAGFGLGIAVVAGPVFARVTGGVERVGLFGAAVQLGIAGGLGMGAILGDLDVDWRLTFLLSAGVAASAIPLLIGRTGPGYVRQAGGGGFLRLALRSSRMWRLGALFIAVFSVPLILGSWLVHYLSVDDGLAAGIAGVLSFLMFGVSAAAREEGGRLAHRGVSPVLLVGVAPLLAAAWTRDPRARRLARICAARDGRRRDRLRPSLRDRDRAGAAPLPQRRPTVALVT